jgi:hypothetical protein
VCTGLLSRKVKLGREADHSPASSAEVKNEWSYTSTKTTLPLHVLEYAELFKGFKARRNISNTASEYDLN